MINFAAQINIIMTKRLLRAALFDLDGVVFDTEGQYSVFWGEQCRFYHPDKPGLEDKIKGQTLVQILDNYFSDMKDEHSVIIRRLDEFERNMKFEYVAGFLDFVSDLRRNGVKTAVVTSSNQAKMNSVYAACKEFKALFDAILTSEDFERSKPDPDCYLKGAATFGVTRDECVVFEDSFNGLKSGRAAGMAVIGLSTTNAAEAIKPYADYVVPDFMELDYNRLSGMLANLN